MVVEGWPEPRGATLPERLEDVRRRQDLLRQAVVCEPRGHDAMVGALLTPAVEPGSHSGVLFFNNVGYLGMCGHGLMGVVRTLAFLGRLGPGIHRFDTPAGTATAELHGSDGSITLENVPARPWARDVELDVPGFGAVVGDVAYGGNWFFLTDRPGEDLSLGNSGALLRFTMAVQEALRSSGVRGDGGAEIDHVEVFGPPRRADADRRNFVLCPGGAFDRSPCGTGTSAKMAALHDRGRLSLGAPWRQEGIAGGLFTGWLRRQGDRLVPHLRGRAFVTARSTLHLDPEDPFRGGFRLG